MTHHEMNIVGIPSTVLAWLSVLKVLNVDPVMGLLFKILSIVWLCMQIYGWVEKRVKDKKHASK